MFRKLSQVETLSPLAPPAGTPALTPFYVSDRHIISSSPVTEDDEAATNFNKTERLGIRRFAKVCSTKWGEMISNTTTPNDEIATPPTLKSPPPVGDKNGILGLDHRKILQIDKNYQEQKSRFKTINDLTISVGFDKDKNLIRKQNTLRAKSSSLGNINAVTGLKFKNLTKSSERLSNRKCTENLRVKRVVVIKNLPSYATVNSVIAQIRGGPLERLIFRTSNQSNSSSIELYFVFPDHAKKFYHYCNNTGLFLINGVHPTIEWANKANTEDLDEYHPLVNRGLLHDIIHAGSRRTLIFAKVIVGKKELKGKELPDPFIHFSSGLDINTIRQDFAVFGEIIDVAPVISRKLCFSLHFTDIRCAIHAKQECEREGSDFYRKYSHWTIWYGKDITDRPCFVL